MHRVPKAMLSGVTSNRYAMTHGDVEKCLDKLNEEKVFDLIITSPPYNIGKEYEKRVLIEEYLKWQKGIISKCVARLKNNGSICWQIGTYIKGTGKAAEIVPLDLMLHEVFTNLGLKLKNRIIWKFGHGLHCKHRFSGRHETILWYTKGDSYVFNLDQVRVKSKYPGKKFSRGIKIGQYSCNPLGKNPEDVWDIPNINHNSLEKTEHPCQFPVALTERLVLALSKENQLVFDPFAGVASTGVAALIHNRRFWGCEINKRFVKIGRKRLVEAVNGTAVYRPSNKPIFDARNAGSVGRHPYEDVNR